MTAFEATQPERTIRNLDGVGVRVFGMAVAFERGGVRDNAVLSTTGLDGGRYAGRDGV